MVEIVIYTTRMCPYCIMAKRLLDKKGVRYTEIDVGSNPRLREELIHKSRRRTVPQIYIDDLHVGGFDELHALDRLKKLDPLLGINPQ
jgi:glutaredoxin 3